MEEESQLPQGFVLHTEWPEFPKERLLPAWVHAAWVGSDPRGLRTGAGPFCLEMYISDSEPRFQDPNDSRDKWRLVAWQRLQSGGVPNGWWRSPVLSSILSVRRPYAETFARIAKDGAHFLSWDSKARLEKWRSRLLGKVYKIDTVSRQIFWDELKNSVTWKRLPDSECDYIHQILFDGIVAPDVLVCRIVRRIDTDETVAGMASIFSDSCKSAYDLLGFMSEGGRSDPVMTGLMHDLFLRAADRGYSNVQFGTSVTEESPPSFDDRRGYSRFKAKFGTEYIRFDPVLFKYTNLSPKL